MNEPVVDLLLSSALDLLAVSGSIDAGEMACCVCQRSSLTILVLGPEVDAENVADALERAWQVHAPQGSC